MTAPRRPLPGVLRAGLAVLVLGVVSWVLYAVQAGRQHTAYQPHGNPPAHVQIHSGHTYWISVPGGVDRVRQLGVNPTSLNCTATSASGRTDLQVAPVVSQQSTDTKFINRIASFVPSISGSVRIECLGLGTVYVDNADDRAFDWSGAWLVLASLGLAIGLALTLSGLRRINPPADRPLAVEGDGDADVVVTEG